MGNRIEREIKTIKAMFSLHKEKHVNRKSDEEYINLLEYSILRLTKCVLKDQKLTCKKCPIHCYKAHQKKDIQDIMRWAGPRMLLYHPVLAILHLIDDKKEPPLHPAELRRKEKQKMNTTNQKFCK